MRSIGCRLRPLASRVGLAALLLFGVGCSDAPSDASTYHAWWTGMRERIEPGDGSAQTVDARSLAALPIVRLSLARSQIYPFTEVEFVIEGDRATRRGGMIDWPAPNAASASTAKVPFHALANLCWLIESLDLPEASQSWEVPAEHPEVSGVSYTWRDGRTVTLSDSGGGGPAVVAALADALENVGRMLAWRPVDG